MRWDEGLGEGKDIRDIYPDGRVFESAENGKRCSECGENMTKIEDIRTGKTRWACWRCEGWF
jgi:formylmethanofuran dehydrogenase subunit E